MTDVLLVLNTGSSSLKFEVFGYEALDKLAKGKVTGIGTEARLSATVVASDVHVDRALAANDQETAMAAVIDLIDRYDDAWRMVATVHRIVHGGADLGAADQDPVAGGVLAGGALVGDDAHVLGLDAEGDDVAGELVRAGLLEGADGRHCKSPSSVPEPAPLRPHMRGHWSSCAF